MTLLDVNSNQVQAASAVAVVLLTGALCWITWQYVKWTKTMANHIAAGNDLQGEANRITASGLAIAQGQHMPKLMARQNSRDVDAGAANARLQVFNLGGDVASNVVVRTTWGDVGLQFPLAPGAEYETVSVSMPRDEWDRLTEPKPERDPTILGFRFRDPTGKTYEVDIDGHPVDESG